MYRDTSSLIYNQQLQEQKWICGASFARRPAQNNGNESFHKVIAIVGWSSGRRFSYNYFSPEIKDHGEIDKIGRNLTFLLEIREYEMFPGVHCGRG